MPSGLIKTARGWGITAVHYCRRWLSFIRNINIICVHQN